MSYILSGPGSIVDVTGGAYSNKLEFITCLVWQGRSVSMGIWKAHMWRESSSREVYTHLWERPLCLGGPEAAGKAPRTAKRQMPPAAEAQTQELAPKKAQQRPILSYMIGIIGIDIIY
jgi:hypothetical protein